MAQAYRNLAEQMGDVLALAGRYLAPLEGEASVAGQAREILLAAQEEARIRQRCRATVEAGGAAPLEYLLRTFGLTDFERHCVYFSLAAELDSVLEARFAALQRDNCRLPSLELCLRTFTADPEIGRAHV